MIPVPLAARQILNTVFNPPQWVLPLTWGALVQWQSALSLLHGNLLVRVEVKLGSGYEAMCGSLVYSGHLSMEIASLQTLHISRSPKILPLTRLGMDKRP